MWTALEVIRVSVEEICFTLTWWKELYYAINWDYFFFISQYAGATELIPV